VVVVKFDQWRWLWTTEEKGKLGRCAGRKCHDCGWLIETVDAAADDIHHVLLSSPIRDYCSGDRHLVADPK
jgi:hypothetical protein